MDVLVTPPALMFRSSMTSHIANAHGIQIRDYKEAKYPDIEVETNWFQCRLCPARTKFVKDCIAPHLRYVTLGIKDHFFVYKSCLKHAKNKILDHFCDWMHKSKLLVLCLKRFLGVQNQLLGAQNV